MAQQLAIAGDHLCYPIDSANQIWHHGIYCGSCRIKGRQLESVVIHFEGKLKGGMIKAIPFNKFARNHDICKVDYKKNSIFTPDRVVRNAISKLGTPDYNLFGNNCEHFAHWCKTGQKVSEQVNSTNKVIINMATGFAIGFLLPTVGIPTVIAIGVSVATGLGTNQLYDLIMGKSEYK